MSTHSQFTTHDSRYTMPAEFAPQSRVWFAWPHAKADWPEKFAPIPWVFAEMLRAVTPHQRVGLIVHSTKIAESAREILSRAHADVGQIDMVQAPTNRGWMRDCGAIFVRDNTGKKTALGFGFNAWAKYPNWQRDAKLPAVMAAQAGAALVQPKYKNKRVVLEGGGIEVNGEGSIIVTEEWLLSEVQVRNPGFTREDYEAVFATYLGAPNTIWLEAGIAGDDTHGHVDDITRFTDARTIVTCIETNPSDANYACLRENKRRLNAARDVDGKAFDVVDLPMPEAVMFEETRLPASYANFLITNKAVLVPVFNDVNDRHALDILADCFKDRDIMPIYARDLVWGLGTIHCLSQQEII
jgi:agmatine deiminase